MMEARLSATYWSFASPVSDGTLRFHALPPNRIQVRIDSGDDPRATARALHRALEREPWADEWVVDLSRLAQPNSKMMCVLAGFRKRCAAMSKHVSVLGDPYPSDRRER